MGNTIETTITPDNELTSESGSNINTQIFDTFSDTEGNKETGEKTKRLRKGLLKLYATIALSLLLTFGANNTTQAQSIMEGANVSAMTSKSENPMSLAEQEAEAKIKRRKFLASNLNALRTTTFKKNANKAKEKGERLTATYTNEYGITYKAEVIPGDVMEDHFHIRISSPNDQIRYPAIGELLYGKGYVDKDFTQQNSEGVIWAGNVLLRELISQNLITEEIDESLFTQNEGFAAKPYNIPEEKLPNKEGSNKEFFEYFAQLYDNNEKKHNGGTIIFFNELDSTAENSAKRMFTQDVENQRVNPQNDEGLSIETQLVQSIYQNTGKFPKQYMEISKSGNGDHIIYLSTNTMGGGQQEEDYKIVISDKEIRGYNFGTKEEGAIALAKAKKYIRELAKDGDGYFSKTFTK